MNVKSFDQRITDCQGLVRSLAWKIHRTLPEHLDVEDLVGYGQVGLAEAAQSFDPERGGQFSTFAYYRVRGAIYDGLAKMTWFSRAHYHQIRNAQMADEVLRLEGEHGGSRDHAATLEEDADWLQGLTRALAVVYLSTQGEDDGEELALADRSASAPPSVAIGNETSRQLHQLIEALPEEAGALIRGVYFEGLSLKEAGERLGVSKAWASRLHAKTLDRLAGSLRRLGVAD